MIRRGLAAAALVLVLLAPAAAHATILACLVSATGVAFGTYTGDRISTTGEITLICVGTGNAPTNPYSVSLSTGQSPNYDPRLMALGSDTLQYNLYTDSLRNVIWGDGTGRTRAVTGRMDFQPPQLGRVALTVEALLPRQPTPPPGRYSDTIVVTVEF